MRKLIDLCKQICTDVPLLPITIVAAVPLALLAQWRPWGAGAFSLPVIGEPGVAQWMIMAMVLYTVVDIVRGMIDDIRHGQVGVDILAVIAILATVAVQEYWASWAVILMVSSGEAIEAYAQSTAERSLTALMQAAPQTAHIVARASDSASDSASDGGESDSSSTDDDASATVGASNVGRAAADAAAASDTAAAASDTAAADASATAGGFRTVPVDQVALGDVIMVLPGETVPVDGELISSSATLDLSNINGEPVPREVYVGARVMSGAVNGSTALTMRATQIAAESQYQRIIGLVAAAQESRPAVVKTADRLAVPFTVLSLLIAGVAWAMSGDPERFAQVLVLATPCPLLIAAPVAYVAGTGRLAKAGILIKTQDVLENLGRVTQVFFDKTGTLTVKQPQVVRVEMLPGTDTRLSEDHVLALSGLVEGYSVHILSQGIAKAGQSALDRLYTRMADGRRDIAIAGIEEIAGKGVSGVVDGHTVRVGRLAFANEQDDGFQLADGSFTSPVQPEPGRAGADAAVRGRTRRAGHWTDAEVRTRFGMLEPDEMASYMAFDGQLIARIVLRDVPRANAKASLARLHELGVRKLTMLTGDKRASARIIADEVGIDEVHAELFPEDKVAAVKAATDGGDPADGRVDAADAGAAVSGGVGKATSRTGYAARNAGTHGRRDDKPVTMMVGDGVNDAPVLAVADLGVAMTDGTSTAASESAQVVIMNDDIASVPRAIAIARRTKRVMLEAVLLGLALAIVGMVAAAFNLIPVVVGAFMQEAIDVVSILWALTALFDRE